MTFRPTPNQGLVSSNGTVEFSVTGTSVGDYFISAAFDLA